MTRRACNPSSTHRDLKNGEGALLEQVASREPCLRADTFLRFIPRLKLLGSGPGTYCTALFWKAYLDSGLDLQAPFDHIHLPPRIKSR